MIDLVNIQPNLTIEQRRSILDRALNAVPFFNLLEYEVATGDTKKVRQYQGKSYINIDFYLTEIRGNFNDVFVDTGTEWNANIYIAETGKSVYGYNRGTSLPTPFLMTDARFNQPVGLQKYEDIQREFIPYEIKKGNEIISEIVNVGAKAEIADAKICLAGFQTIQYPYLNAFETEKINKSFERDTVFQTFRFKVDHDGQKFYNLNNDSVPRHILGFGIVNGSSVVTDASVSDMSIYDSTRQLRLTNQQNPVSMIAPRIPSVRDTHIYYLPIEHYFVPFGNIRFLINNDLDSEGDYEVVMLTRTV